MLLSQNRFPNVLPIAFLIGLMGISKIDAAPPNFVVILCDDLGWGDLQNYGHPHIKTPNLIRMAEEGIRFTDFYSAAPVCSPSRVGLLTGRTPNRAGVYDWIPDADPNRPLRQSRELVHLRDSEVTIPGLLKSAGYATCMSGKWHCNAMFNSERQAQPGDHGFDHWFATQNNASPSHANPKNFVRNGAEVGPLEGYSCQLVADEFIGWLGKHKQQNPSQPFFGYVAYHEPHEPVASPQDLVKKYQAAGARNEDEAHYFANVENLDAATGRILKAIDDLGYRDDTLVVFTSDNGPETLSRYRRANRSYGTPGPLRGMKLHTHEAGYRVAGIMRWPKRIAAGQVSSEPVCSLDFLPTFAKLSGARLPEDRLLDGDDFLPALAGGTIKRRRPLMWIYYHSYTEQKHYVPSVSFRDGDLKIRARIDGFKGVAQVDQANIDAVRDGELTGFEIYDLSTDKSESNPLPVAGSDLPAKLREQYRAALETFHIWPAIKRQK
ncbi:MAG: sulfatase-like hydrolase/transferase [Planctomycetota bacterium]